MAIPLRRDGEPRKRMPRAAREQLMVDVATEAFAARGFHACSMEEIAEGAGVTKPMVYAYFGSKEGMYVACMTRVLQPLLEQIGADRGDLPADRQLWAGINAFFSFVEANRQAWSRMYLDASAVGGEAADAAQRLRTEVVRVVSQLIVEAARAEGVDDSLTPTMEPLAHAFVGAAEELGRWWLDHPEEPASVVSGILMNFAWQGFASMIRGDLWDPRTGAGGF